MLSSSSAMLQASKYVVIEAGRESAGRESTQTWEWPGDEANWGCGQVFIIIMNPYSRKYR